MDYGKIIKSFGILNRTFLSYITKSIATEDISYSDSIFLVNIGKCEGITQEQIAHSLAIDKAAIARSVKEMIRKGYVRAETSQADKRAKELYLTDTGRELFFMMEQLNDEWMIYVLQDLKEDEIESFSSIVERICIRSKEYPM